MKTLTELSQAIKSRQMSCRDAVSLALAAAEKWQPQINAFRATYAEPSLEAAEKLDKAPGRRSADALFGVPLAHKDMFDWPGHCSSYGSRIVQKVPSSTAATILSRLENAGAINFGFLSMAEFALGPTGHNAVFGHCRNAHDSERISGGSSAGSGAAVGAGIIPGSFGSDTGGSLRIPASVNGITGLKPTQGQLSRAGAMLLSPSLDCLGPLGRSSEDCAILMAAVSGRDPRDPTALALSSANGTPFSVQQFEPRKLRIGVSQNMSEVDSDVLASISGAVASFERSGVQVVDVELPDIEHLHKLADVIQKAESAAVHFRRLTESANEYTSCIRRRIQPGYLIPATTYIHALAQRELWLNRFVEETLADVDALIVPTIGVAVPTIEETDEAANGAMPELVSRMTRWTRWLNYLGVPALSVPCGQDRNGMPVGMQLVGRPFSEASLLAIGMWFQTITDWHRLVPDLFSEPRPLSEGQFSLKHGKE